MLTVSILGLYEHKWSSIPKARTTPSPEHSRIKLGTFVRQYSTPSNTNPKSNETASSKQLSTFELNSTAGCFSSYSDEGVFENGSGIHVQSKVQSLLHEQ